MVLAPNKKQEKPLTTNLILPEPHLSQISLLHFFIADRRRRSRNGGTPQHHLAQQRHDDPVQDDGGVSLLLFSFRSSDSVNRDCELGECLCLSELVSLREQTQQQHQHMKHCAPLVRLRRSTNPNPFSILVFWLAKSLRSLCFRVQLSQGLCLRRIQCHDMVVSNTVLYASSGFIEEGKGSAMEGLSLDKRNEAVEEIKGRENGGRKETFGDLIEEKGHESSSSSEFLSSETTGHEEQSPSSTEGTSSSLPSIGWPVQEIAALNCTSPHGSEDGEKKALGE